MNDVNSTTGVFVNLPHDSEAAAMATLDIRIPRLGFQVGKCWIHGPLPTQRDHVSNRTHACMQHTACNPQRTQTHARTRTGTNKAQEDTRSLSLCCRRSDVPIESKRQRAVVHVQTHLNDVTGPQRAKTLSLGDIGPVAFASCAAAAANGITTACSMIAHRCRDTQFVNHTISTQTKTHKNTKTHPRQHAKRPRAYRSAR